MDGGRRLRFSEQTKGQILTDLEARRMDTNLVTAKQLKDCIDMYDTSGLEHVYRNLSAAFNQLLSQSRVGDREIIETLQYKATVEMLRRKLRASSHLITPHTFVGSYGLSQTHKHQGRSM